MPLLGCRNSLRVGSNNPFSLYETLRVVLEIKSLEDRNQELEKRVKQEDADKEQLRQERAKTELQSRQIVEKLRAEVAQESECHKDTKRKRPYESQLAMLLAISLCTEWRRNYPTTPFALNSFQGNLDRDLADIFGATNRFCWLLELKRDRGNISSEWKKPIRKLQRQQIQENGRIRDIADKCHWLSWGEKDKVENTVLRFLRY
jgi:vacuolar-type H+-ATPase subunit I/STV1